MPSNFTNPYNFVRLGPQDQISKQSPSLHSTSQTDLLSGRLVCRLYAISPIFIPNQNENNIHRITLQPNNDGPRSHFIYKKFFDIGDGIPTIPGSSLKGDIRSVAEALANGCYSVTSKGDPHYPNPSLAPCSEWDNLCPTCRLFGMPTAGEAKNEGEEAEPFYKGTVHFKDARLEGNAQDLYYQEPWGWLLPELSDPKPRHRLFYALNYKMVGRKFYYHRDSRKPDKGNPDDQKILAKYKKHPNQLPNEWYDGLHRTCSIVYLGAGAIFHFEIDYQNLTKDDLALLIYALELEPKLVLGEDLRPAMENGDFVFQPGVVGVYHKIGYGKPAGLGSCAVYIQEWKRLDLKKRYETGDGWQVVSAAELRSEVEAQKLSFLRSQKAGISLLDPASPLRLQDLGNILRYPNKIQEIRYPQKGRGRDEGEFENYQLPEPGKETLTQPRR